MVITTFMNHLTTAARQRSLPLAAVAAKCLDAGITGLDLLTANLQDLDTLDRLLGTGMHVNSFAAFTDFLHDGSDAAVEQVLENVLRVGAKTLLVIPGILRETDTDASVERSIDAVRRLCNLAAPLGLCVGMEPFDNAASPIATCRGLQRYLDAVEQLSCIFDTGNFFFSGEDVLAAYRIFKPRITRQLHCKDRSLTPRVCEDIHKTADGRLMYAVPVGGGILPVAQIAADLADSGFDGSITIEHFGSSDQMGDLLASAACLRSALSL